VPLLLNKSDALAQMGRWNEALAALGSAEKLAPKAGEIPLKKGDILQVTKQWDSAIAAYKTSLALAPDQPITYNNLALAQQGSGKQLDKAKEYAQKAVDISPKSAPFWDTLGWIQRSAGDLVGARNSLKKAIELEGNVAIFHYHLGVVLADQKDKAEAIKAIQAALKLDPQFEEHQQARVKLKELGAG
jgi:tetratricopeptide (TPR) repeat protein